MSLFMCESENVNVFLYECKNVAVYVCEYM